VETTLQHFVEQVGPALRQFGHQALHGDINTDNIVVDDDAGELVAGLFDFGDMSHGPRVVEAAITAAYQCLGSDPTAAVLQVVSGFHLEDPLDLGEVELIPDLVAARCVQSLLMSARHVATRADNTEYATGDEDLMWATLEGFDLLDHQAVANEIAIACGLHRPKRRPLDGALALREQRLGPSLGLSYEQPVHLDHGSGVWLIDTDVASQARTLSTNTRYLVDGVAEYAGRLADLMPDPLSVVLFVNSGSEANDLAYRIARAVTGARGVITTDNAYHGSTLATAAMSPEESDWTDLEPWAARVAGTEMLADPAAADRISNDLISAQHQLAERGETPAMAIFDTVFSSEGIFEIPDGVLKAARAWASEAGALLVADEVQAGFGRIGPSFWGFARHKVVPDIVTLGKPMGNGHPMGAVVTTRAIADQFASESHFFSTFAGSPVAAAVGMAVIDVVEREGLAANAERVGAYLKQQIEALAHPDIVEVRGPGLFVGVELESHRLATRTVNDMRQDGVLIGATGPSGNVLKIRPPLVFRDHHADRVVDALRRSLAGD
jgi:4-aminobutyrate aminotransferase-like enzyme